MKVHIEAHPYDTALARRVGRSDQPVLLWVETVRVRDLGDDIEAAHGDIARLPLEEKANLAHMRRLKLVHVSLTELDADRFFQRICLDSLAKRGKLRRVVLRPVTECLI